MSTSNFEKAQDLTHDEQILHHHAAMIKKDLEVYRTCSRSQEDWAHLFRDHLACLVLYNQLLQVILILIQTKSMNFFANTCEKNPEHKIRTHPLLLSLTKVIDESETNPNISAVSENDKRVLGSKFYTSPTEFPPLEIHFLGQNGLSPFSS
jgi:hypothetical protein